VDRLLQVGLFERDLLATETDVVGSGHIKVLRGDRPVIVACDTGNTSVRAAGRLKALGFTQAVSLAGGFRAWVQGGLPLEK